MEGKQVKGGCVHPWGSAGQNADPNLSISRPRTALLCTEDSLIDGSKSHVSPICAACIYITIEFLMRYRPPEVSLASSNQNPMRCGDGAVAHSAIQRGPDQMKSRDIFFLYKNGNDERKDDIIFRLPRFEETFSNTFNLTERETGVNPETSHPSAKARCGSHLMEEEDPSGTKIVSASTSICFCLTYVP
jgi:hypothetical protein